MILTVQVDMADKQKLGKAIIGGFIVTGSLFTITTVLAAIWYGGDLEYNLIGTLPSSQLLDINALFVTLQVCLSTVVGCTTLFQDLEDRLGIRKEFNPARCILRTSLVILSVSLSEIVPRFDLIMGLVGGLMMGPLMFVLPPLFYYRLQAMERQPEYQPLLSESKQVTTMVFNTRECDLHRTMKSHYFVNPEYKGEEKRTNKEYLHEVQPNYIKFTNPMNLCSKIQRNLRSLLCLNHNYPKIDSPPFWEKLKTIMIVSAGLLATFLSTYYTLLETIEYARFTPPCVVNVTAATLAIE